MSKTVEHDLQLLHNHLYMDKADLIKQGHSAEMMRGYEACLHDLRCLAKELLNININKENYQR